MIEQRNGKENKMPDMQERKKETRINMEKTSQEARDIYVNTVTKHIQ